MQAGRSTVSRRSIGLQKVPVGIELNRQQVGDIQNAGAFAEILADASFFGKSEAIGIPLS
jgi:hypothetical protein